ncbi:MAG TPA: PsiF family protein [Burkholderiales bacterium]|nr:PsiF family protein [Burkholderiales bacterium]
MRPAPIATGTPQDKAKSEEKKELTEQQKRMQQCNADATKQQFKDGDARQALMRACLKGEKKMTQQERMTACNKQAGDKGLKGADRKAFMSK